MYIKKGNVEINFDEKKLERKFNKVIDKAQYLLDNKVVRDTEPFTPMLTGNLDRSVLPSAQTSKGLLKYNVPYARKLYYNTKFNFTKTFHPRAGAFWFETAKKIYKKDWIKFAKMEFARWWKS